MASLAKWAAPTRWPLLCCSLACLLGSLIRGLGCNALPCAHTTVSHVRHSYFLGVLQVPCFDIRHVFAEVQPPAQLAQPGQPQQGSGEAGPSAGRESRQHVPAQPKDDGNGSSSNGGNGDSAAPAARLPDSPFYLLRVSGIPGWANE